MSALIRARTIGTSSIDLANRRLTPKTDLTFALAAYLCVRAGEHLSRSHLIEVFWPTSEEANGRHNLRQLLYRLRGSGLRVSDEGEDVCLDPRIVDCDARAILRGDDMDDSSVESFRATPEFLPNVRRDISDALRDWLDAVGRRVATAYTHRALARIREALEQGRWADSCSWADALLAVDPMNEEATLSKAESIAMAGSKAAALELIDAYIADLGPHASRLALPARILRRRISERRSDWGAHGTREIPLFGREQLMARLAQQLEEVSHQRGSASLLIGPAGVGKSRLCQEIRGRAELRGFRCVEAKGEIASASRPLSFIVSLATALRDLPGSAGAAPQAMSVLRRLTQDRDAAASTDAISATDLSVEYLVWTVTEVLSAICTESRVLIIIDDLHHIDASSTSVISSIATALASQRLAFVVTTRLGHTLDSPPLDSVPHALRFTVPPLTDEASFAMASSLAEGLTRELAEADIRRIVRAAGGNPLFLRELTSLHDTTATTTGLPRSLRHLIEARLSRLSAQHTRVLRLVTLLGPLATISRLRALVHASSSSLALVDSVEQLEVEGILTADEHGVLRVHECWQNGVQHGLQRATLGALSLECAESLVANPGDSDPIDRLWRAADLYATAGCGTEARVCLTNAGDALLSRGLARQAAAAFGRALSLARGDLERTHLLSKRVRAHSIAGEYQNAIADARLGLDLSPQTGPHSDTLRVELLAALAESLWRDGQPHQVALEDLAAAAAHADIPIGLRHSTCLAGLRLVFVDTASAHAAHFAGIIERTTHEEGPTLSGHLGRLIFASECGSEEQIRSACADLERFPMIAESALVRAKSLRYRAAALRFVGDLAASRSLLETAFDVSYEAGELQETYDCALALVFLALDQGDLDFAERALEQSAQVMRHTPPFFQQRQSKNAEMRLLLQRGRYAECLALSKTALPTARADAMGRRQSADLVCAALSAAHCGDSQLAAELAEICIRTLRADRPCGVLDFSAEATVRTLRVLSRHAEADSLAEEYVARRRHYYPRALPAAMKELAAAMSRESPRDTDRHLLSPVA